MFQKASEACSERTIWHVDDEFNPRYPARGSAPDIATPDLDEN